MSLSLTQIVDAWTGRAGDSVDFDDGDIAEFLRIFAEESNAILESGFTLSEDAFFTDLGEPGAPAVLAATGIPIEEYVGADASRNEAIVKKGFLAKVKKYLNRLPKAREMLAMYFAMLDGTTPVWVKAAIAGGLAYFILPLDAVPDILFPIGFMDDFGVLAAVLGLVAAYISQRHYAKADDWLKSEGSDHKRGK